MKRKVLSMMTASILAAVSYSPVVSADWKYGIGTGISRLNVEGDITVESAYAPAPGTVVLDVDLDPDDISDLMDTAFGFSGYATDGNWLVTYSYGSMTLKGTSFPQPGVRSDVEFENTSVGVQVGHPVLKRDNFKLNLLGGIRSISHELKNRFDNGTTSLANTRDNDWTDLVLGATAFVKFAPKWQWVTQLDAGFGDSEGSTYFRTALDWRFAERWSASFFVQAAAIEMENSSPGNADYYLYDNDETSLGAFFLFHW